MATAETIDLLKSRIQTRFPVLFLATWEEDRWEGELASLALSLDLGLVVWTATLGACPALEDAAGTHRDPEQFLDQIRRYPRDHVFLLKDFHPFLVNPLIVRQIRDLLPTLAAENKTVLLMSPDPVIPMELRRDAIKIELPLPGLDDLKVELKELLIEKQHSGEPPLKLSSSQKEKLLKAVAGLTARQAKQSLARALHQCTAITDEVYALLVAEKRHMVQGSEFLEFYDLGEGVADIGGLDALKEWLAKRSHAFSLNAQAKGIPAPKGVLLLGVQGCGKSLTSRAIARLLSLPLVRLDVSSLLSSDRGQSEKNLRDVLVLTEMISPVVLWLDEIEKGFAGVDGEGGDSTMVRLMGRFLTWMQEKPAGVFIVATANSVTGLPPELLRRGRFDELFFVDLPNFHERKSILEIHLRKRRFDPLQFDLTALAEMTEGYSGAEIEQSVLASMVEAFHRDSQPQQEDLKRAIEDTVPLSVTMEEKIFQLREWARPRCRAATPDSRVLQMLEAEQRAKTGSEAGGMFNLLAEDDEPESEDSGWQIAAQNGEISSAIYEYVVEHGEVAFDRLQREFAAVLDTAGEFGIALRSDPNIVLWLGMNADVAAAFSRLLTDRKLFAVRADGGIYGDASPTRLTKLPALPDGRVSRPCWFPALLTSSMPDDLDERLTRVARMKLSR